MPVVCPKCGENNSDDTMMCGMCGEVLRRISTSAQPKTSQPTGPQTAATPPSPPPMPGRTVPTSQTMAPPRELRAANAQRANERTSTRMMASRSQRGEPAGFWLRFAAIFIDGILVNLVTVIFVFIYILVLSSTHQEGGGTVGKSILEGSLLTIFAVMLLGYHIGMESSPLQGTLGKVICGIMVTDQYGERISFWRSVARFLCKYISALPFYIGFLMVAFTEDKRGLHDMIAGTEVVRRF